MRTSILSNPDLIRDAAEQLAARLAATMHIPAHVVNDHGHLLICDDHDVACWGLDQIVYSVEPELAYDDPPGDNPLGDTEGDECPDEYHRDPRFDTSTADAWRDTLGLLRWVAVGRNPNHSLSTKHAAV